MNEENTEEEVNPLQLCLVVLGAAMIVWLLLVVSGLERWASIFAYAFFSGGLAFGLGVLLGRIISRAKKARIRREIQETQAEIALLKKEAEEGS